MKAPFDSEQKLLVRAHDWQLGEMDIPARFVRMTSDTHAKVRTDDGLFFAVPLADCRVDDDERVAT